jgi:hypothetical protein
VLNGNFGLSVEDRVRMIERNKAAIPTGSTIWYVTYRAYDALYDKVVEKCTLDTTDKTQAQAQYAKRKANPHNTNVRLNKGIAR